MIQGQCPLCAHPKPETDSVNADQRQSQSDVEMVSDWKWRLMYHFRSEQEARMYGTFSFLFFHCFFLHQDVWAKGADSDSETAVVDTKVRGDGWGREWLGAGGGLPETREADFSWALAFVAAN